ncbi:MAG: (2Fe-2S)-binding protein [Pseudomonadales bacterium]|nr:(2Fe-2S)-binding protein [Pseudomonadales bacterium]NRA16263.1 (2Fe-2S)-binding protein [Oceanospirillaceae bacterium]
MNLDVSPARLSTKSQQPGDVSVFDQLTQMSAQLLPALAHRPVAAIERLRLGDSHSPALKKLLQNLELQHPESGKLFYSHKCWQLIIWQPVLLSIISVYGLNRGLAFNKLHLQCHSLSIAGYQLEFNPDDVIDGCTEQLISHCARGSATLIWDLYRQLNIECPLKQRFCQRLLSDQLLKALAQVPVFLPHLERAVFQQHIQLWMRHYQLPIRALKIDPRGEIVRSSCCLEYLIEHSGYCTNCPKERKSPHVAT